MRLPSLSDRKIIRAIQQIGFIEAPDRGKGSHRAFTKIEPERVRLVIVPKGKDIPHGTLLSILDQAGLTKEQFLRMI